MSITNLVQDIEAAVKIQEMLRAHEEHRAIFVFYKPEKKRKPNYISTGQNKDIVIVYLPESILIHKAPHSRREFLISQLNSSLNEGIDPESYSTNLETHRWSAIDGEGIERVHVPLKIRNDALIVPLGLTLSMTSNEQVFRCKERGYETSLNGGAVGIVIGNDYTDKYLKIQKWAIENKF